MSIVPENLHWWWFPIVLICLSIITTVGASYINLFEFLQKAMNPRGTNERSGDLIEEKLA
jgi:hypothetical protein